MMEVTGEIMTAVCLWWIFSILFTWRVLSSHYREKWLENHRAHVEIEYHLTDIIDGLADEIKELTGDDDDER
jgi:hypothetical protein